MKTITVYYYSELSEESKKKAIDNVENNEYLFFDNGKEYKG